MSMGIIAAVAAPVVIGGIGAIVNNKKANDMQGDINTASQTVDNLIANRQDIYNASDDIRALKQGLNNAYANLSVATKATEMQMQQTDVALANMLEGGAAAGFGAASATALAQAAAKSKQGISADIEKQEVANQKLKAQGEKELQAQKMQIEQQAIAADQQAWQAQEAREVYDINRAQAELDALTGQQTAYADASTDALMGGLSGATSVLSAGVGAGKIGG